ncbi:TraR/DksA C4-type zinc finger protein [bacterium]|nr:TraR/DksA C4-type zinc finger protein [bacterium]
MDQETLEYFKNALLELLQQTQEELEFMGNPLAEENRLPDDNDIASVQYEQSYQIRMKERNEKYIKKIKKALRRLDDGEYDICEECGNEISIERLKARPVATICIDCKKQMEKEARSAK